MKKIVPQLLIIIIPLLFSSFCKGNVSVQPPEISITMKDEFIHGDTSKKITITNTNNNNINATWYLEHPPISLIRPNRTFMPNLSWIDVRPRWNLILPNSTGEFFIYLNIPENIETLDKHWETWITFKGEKGEFGEGFFNFEYAIRVYIDTPVELAITNNSLNNDSSHDSLYDPVHLVLAAAVATTILLLGAWIYNKRK